MCALAVAYLAHNDSLPPPRPKKHGQDHQQILEESEENRSRRRSVRQHGKVAAFVRQDVRERAARAHAPSAGEAGYTAKHIEVLEGLEPVRRRPGMYIGGTDEKALHHLFAEVIDNAMDEAVAGHATFIEVELDADGFVTRAPTTAAAFRSIRIRSSRTSRRSK